MPRAEGVVLLPDGEPALRGARARIRVEDVSRQDAPAGLLAEREAGPITEEQARLRRLPFAIEYDDRGEGCAVRVHLDIDGDGAVGVGDYVTAAHVALPAGAGAAPLSIALSRVGGRRP
jgi:hypothetical protein